MLIMNQLKNKASRGVYNKKNPSATTEGVNFEPTKANILI